MPEQKCFCSGILLYAVCNMPVLEVRIFINGDAHYLYQRCALSLAKKYRISESGIWDAFLRSFTTCFFLRSCKFCRRLFSKG